MVDEDPHAGKDVLEKNEIDESLHIVHDVFDSDFLEDKYVLEPILQILQTVEHSQDHQKLEYLETHKNLVDSSIDLLMLLVWISGETISGLIKEDWKTSQNVKDEE